MPKTYTSDVGTVLPSALEGPFQVVDPNDINSYFKIDPALSRIEAAGDARPTRQLNLVYTTGYGLTSFKTLGTAVAGRKYNASGDTGFYPLPFLIPPDMDLSQPATVKVMVAPEADTTPADVIRFELVTSYGKDGDTSLTDLTTTYDWTVPANWTTDDLKLVTIDDGTGITIPAGTFESADIVGFRLIRRGSAVEDTFAKSIIMAKALHFVYTANQI